MVWPLQNDETYPGRTEKLTILKIDIDKSPQTASVYQIQGVPTLILFKNGQIKWRQSGVVSVTQLIQIMKQYVA